MFTKSIQKLSNLLVKSIKDKYLIENIFQQTIYPGNQNNIDKIIYHSVSCQKMNHFS